MVTAISHQTETTCCSSQGNNGEEWYVQHRAFLSLIPRVCGLDTRTQDFTKGGGLLDNILEAGKRPTKPGVALWYS